MLSAEVIVAGKDFLAMNDKNSHYEPRLTRVAALFRSFIVAQYDIGMTPAPV